MYGTSAVSAYRHSRSKVPPDNAGLYEAVFGVDWIKEQPVLGGLHHQYCRI
jgi:hypothetical protein